MSATFPTTVSTWAKIVAPFVQPAGSARILDLGAGTGRFSTLFARVFEAQVIGIEPSKGMLAVANRGAKLRNLAYAAGAAECIPLRSQSCTLAWLSHVWHHIRDHRACGSELRRIVARGGHALVRGTLGDQLDGFPTLFQYWPATQTICQQLPTIQQTVRVFEANRFALAEHRRVQQVTATSLGEFAKRTQLRADTALALISDSEFREGQVKSSRAGTSSVGWRSFEVRLWCQALYRYQARRRRANRESPSERRNNEEPLTSRSS
jgi:ubiquinone/menaquinone biosynthesis C-methylase UbiE